MTDNLNDTPTFSIYVSYVDDPSTRYPVIEELFIQTLSAESEFEQVKEKNESALKERGAINIKSRSSYSINSDSIVVVTTGWLLGNGEPVQLEPA